MALFEGSSGLPWYTETMVERAAKAIHGGHGCACRGGARGDARAVLDAIGDPRREVGQYYEEALREDREKWSFRALVAVARLMLDRLYPADTMGAMAEDPGPKFTLALRAALDELEGHDRGGDA